MFKMMAASMLGVALCLGFTACSDDDENENGEGGENTATVVNPSQVFTGGLPKSVSGMAISHNEEGLVTNITTEDGDKAVFEYFPATTKADVAKDRARITVTDEEGDVTELNLQLNSDGYVEFCNSIDHAGTPDADEFTWEMEYDTEGHLVVMKRSESDGEITNITYKDGDVVKTSTRYVASGDLNGDGIIDSNDEWEYSAAIDYTTDNITAPIENKGCLMLFDEILDVDMDELNKAKERAHILEGLLKALDYIDEVIEIIRASKNVAEARDNLIKRFEFSQAQAQAIVDMRLRALTGLEREKLQNEYDELEKKIAELEAILADEKVLLGVIREEILLIRDKYGDDRRTSIEMDMEDLSDEALIPRKDAIITFSKLGYIKRMTPDNFHSQNRGGKGIKGMNVIDEDHIEDLFMTSTHNYIMFFTNKGRVYRLKGYEIPESSRTARGVNIINLLQLQPEEKITAIIPLSEDGKQHYLVMATRNGIVKKTGFDEYKNVRKNGLAAISLREGDELIEVKQTDENEDIFLVSREGQCIRFKLQDVRETGRVSMGVIGMNLGDTDEVVGMQIHSEGDDLLIVSEKGMGKRTPLDEFTVQHRGGKGLRCYKITEKTGYVIGVKTIKPEEEIMLITTEGIVIRMKSDSISVIGRNTSGVKLINIDADSDIKVASVAKVRFQEEDESEDMEEDISEVSEETVSDENEAIENETAPEEV